MTASTDYAARIRSSDALAGLRALRGEPISLAATTTTSNRMPPYGKDVAAAVAAGRAVNVYVYAGPNAWQRARDRLASHGPASAMVLPPGDDPAAYRWPRIPGGVLVDARDIDRQTALRIATCIVSCGTGMVFVVRNGEGFAVASSSWQNPLSPALQVAA